MAINIHPTAIVDESCEIGDSVTIGPFCIVEQGVSIEKGTILYSHVVIKGNTKIGEYNKIYSHVTIGEVNQDLKYNGEDTEVIIGNRNSIRENCTIHRGTIQDNGKTIIGDDNLLMVNVHVAHDCIIKNRCILANNVTLGGHVYIDDFAILGGMTAVHQNSVIGAHVMIGGCSGVAQDVLPFVLAQGNHAKAFGLNVEGLRRRGFTRDTLSLVKEVYNLIYNKDGTIENKSEIIAQMAKEDTALSFFVNFFKLSKRGIVASVNRKDKK